MTEPEGAIVADANTSELTRIRARVRELEAALRLTDEALVTTGTYMATRHGGQSFNQETRQRDGRSYRSAREAARRALEVTDAND